MDADGWIAVATGIVALVGLPAAYLSVRYGRSQAVSARGEAQIAKQTYDREDRPDFDATPEAGARGIMAVTLKATAGPPRIKVNAVWTSVSYVQDGNVREDRMSFERGPTALEVRRGESFGFPVKVDPLARTGQVTFDLFCLDATDESRGWECPVVVDWSVMPRPRIY